MNLLIDDWSSINSTSYKFAFAVYLRQLTKTILSKSRTNFQIDLVDGFMSQSGY
jgi:hypothetical protein